MSAWTTLNSCRRGFESEDIGMLSQRKLIAAIQEDLAVCRKNGRELTDSQSLEQKKLEVAALLRHLQMTEEVGYNQAELERVLRSLESNPALKAYQRWRERAAF